MSNRIDDLQARMTALRLSRKRLHELTGLDEDTIGRTLNRKTRPLYDTLDKMEAAVAAEEAALVLHLQKLPATAGGDAA